MWDSTDGEGKEVGSKGDKGQGTEVPGTGGSKCSGIFLS